MKNKNANSFLFLIDNPWRLFVVVLALFVVSLAVVVAVKGARSVETFETWMSACQIFGTVLAALGFPTTLYQLMQIRKRPIASLIIRRLSKKAGGKWDCTPINPHEVDKQDIRSRSPMFTSGTRASQNSVGHSPDYRFWSASRKYTGGSGNFDGGIIRLPEGCFLVEGQKADNNVIGDDPRAKPPTGFCSVKADIEEEFR